jgi:hypothetical protein
LGEDLLKEILDIFNDEIVFDSGLTINEVIDRLISRDAPQNKRMDIHKRLFGMYEDGLISVMDSANIQFMKDLKDISRYASAYSVRIRISADGFGLLNDIRMKKIMEDVTAALNTTNTSVNELTEATKKFNINSESFSTKLNRYTVLLLLFTIIISIASLAQIYSYVPKTISLENFLIIRAVFIVGVGVFVISLLPRSKKTKDKK